MQPIRDIARIFSTASTKITIMYKNTYPYYVTWIKVYMHPSISDDPCVPFNIITFKNILKNISFSYCVLYSM